MKTGRQRKARRKNKMEYNGILSWGMEASIASTNAILKSMNWAFPGKCTRRKIKRGYIKLIDAHLGYVDIKQQEATGETRKFLRLVFVKIRDVFQSITDRLGIPIIKK